MLARHDCSSRLLIDVASLVVGRGGATSVVLKYISSFSSVGVEEQLRVVKGSTVSLVDADRHENLRLPGSLADGVRGRRWHGYRQIEQLPMLWCDDVLHGRLDERKIGVVRHDGLRERRELHLLMAELVDGPHDLFDRPLAAIEHGAQLNCSSFHNSHGNLLAVSFMTRWWRSASRWECRRTSHPGGGKRAAASCVAGSSPRHAGSARRRYGS